MEKITEKGKCKELLKKVFDDSLNDDECCGLCGADNSRSLSYYGQYVRHEEWCVIRKIMEYLKLNRR